MKWLLIGEKTDNECADSCYSPLYSCDDYNNRGNADKWRTLIKQRIDELEFSNVTYINGLDVLGDMSLISTDEVHPNIYGVYQIEERLYEIFKANKK